MARSLFKIGHEKCGSSDALQVFEDSNGKVTGFCFSCGEYIEDPLGDKPKDWRPPKLNAKTPEQADAEIAEISGYQTLDHPDRGLKKWAFEHFGVKHAVSQQDGYSIIATFFPIKDSNGNIARYKAKTVDKKMWSVGYKNDLKPFGWDEALRAGGKSLFITEGEHDAVALFQALKEGAMGTTWADLDPAVISINNGAANAVKEVSPLLADIRRHGWENIIIVFDMDEPGQKAAEALAKVCSGKVANLPCKDPNECIMQGKSKKLFQATRFNSKPPRKSSLIMGSELREAARKKPEFGKPWPWPTLTDLTRGRRRGETIYFGAGVKMGKSEFVNALAKQIIVDDGLPCLLIKPEEAAARTYQKVVGKVAGKIFHDPKIPFDERAFDRAESKVGDRAIVMGSYQFVDWDTTKLEIIEAVQTHGVKDVIIDPITCFTNTMSATETNEFLQKMAAELSAMAKDMDFTAYIFCHLKAPGGEKKSHERGGEVLSAQFAGSRAMMRACNYMIGIQGNKDPDLSDAERNIRTLVLLEDREFGMVGQVHVTWSPETGLFQEIGQ